MSYDEDVIIKEYQSGSSRTKLMKKYGISVFDFGILLGKAGVKKRPTGRRIYTVNRWGVQKNHMTVIPRGLREEIKPGQILEWSKVPNKKGEFTVHIV